MIWRLLREPDDASFSARVRYVGRLTVFYVGVGLLGGGLVILAAAALALTIGHTAAFAAS